MGQRPRRYIGRGLSEQILGDPDPDVPLVILHMVNGEEKTPPPPLKSIYQKLVIKDGTNRTTWYVHRSFSGAYNFLCQALGESKIVLDDDNSSIVRAILVPAHLVGSYNGYQHMVVKFLSKTLGNGIEIRAE